jgi:hypothetical protein
MLLPCIPQLATAHKMTIATADDVSSPSNFASATLIAPPLLAVRRDHPRAVVAAASSGTVVETGRERLNLLCTSPIDAVRVRPDVLSGSKIRLPYSAPSQLAASFAAPPHLRRVQQITRLRRTAYPMVARCLYRRLGVLWHRQRLESLPLWPAWKMDGAFSILSARDYDPRHLHGCNRPIDIPSPVSLRLRQCDGAEIRLGWLRGAVSYGAEETLGRKAGRLPS